eukprot:TRINITY_DN2415_c0_g1_i1.p1 TRINITY_DN2415_c0_g1~~TRINITY_DN2415_c0_g1_i1.p1  ORF type:complete len:322 (+),score=77.17 TRINITY_DN2415_c0_g1_i1:25-990(+)
MRGGATPLLAPQQLMLLLVVACVAAEGLNTRPVVGIITEPSPSAVRKYGAEFIAASYVKFVEAGGARVVPVRYSTPSADLKTLMGQLNGLLLPGGGVDFNTETVYVNALQTLFSAIKYFNDNGDYLPLWGTCLGIEELMILASDNFDILDCNFDAENITLPLDYTNLAPTSRLFGSSCPDDIYNILGTEPVTMNNHGCGMTTTHFFNTPSLNSFYNVLSTNTDRQGLEFVSTMEAVKYPIYGVQWHPEKPLFEWRVDEAMNHDATSVAANSYTTQFLVSEARKSNHSFPSQDAESAALIYNYQPVYTADLDSDYQQCYFFG